MSERKITFDSHRPILGKGVTLVNELNVTRYATMTSENMRRNIVDIPMKIGGVTVPIPTVLTEGRIPLSDIVFELRNDVEVYKTPFGEFPVGGIEQKTFKDQDSKIHKLNLVVPAHIDEPVRNILLDRIVSLVPEQRNDYADLLRNGLPSISFHQDKALMFQASGSIIFSLSPHGPLIHSESVEDDDATIRHNFNDSNPEFGYFIEYSRDQHEDPYINENGEENSMRIVAGVSFPNSKDFIYLNTYLKTYLDNGGHLTDQLIRSELMDPYLNIILIDRESKGVKGEE